MKLTLNLPKTTMSMSNEFQWSRSSTYRKHPCRLNFTEVQVKIQLPKKTKFATKFASAKLKGRRKHVAPITSSSPNHIICDHSLTIGTRATGIDLYNSSLKSRCLLSLCIPTKVLRVVSNPKSLPVSGPEKARVGKVRRIRNGYNTFVYYLRG